MTSHASQRVRAPELELDVGRTPSLGYEPPGSFGCVRCLEHGFPNPLVRWHYHEEYELHLIVASRGKVFVPSLSQGRPSRPPSPGTGRLFYG